MNHLLPFSSLKGMCRLLSVRDQLKVDLNYDEFLEIVKKLLLAVPIDEAWYLATYPDIADAIKAEAYANARQHFVENGYFEGRRPSPPEVDETWYLQEYPDVQTGIADGSISSAFEHFVAHGYDEGRLPMRP